MISAKIKAIGANAISSEDHLAILFDDTATSDLKNIAIVQEIDRTAMQAFELKKGDPIKIGQSVYKIEFIGSLVNNNLQTIGHTTLAFQRMPETPLASAIYLSPQVMPDFKIGDLIQYG